MMPQRVLRIPRFVPEDKIAQYSEGQLDANDPDYPVAAVWAKLLALGQCQPEELLSMKAENTRLQLENVALRQAFLTILQAKSARQLVN